MDYIPLGASTFPFETTPLHPARLDTARGLAAVAERAYIARQHGKCRRALAALLKVTDKAQSYDVMLEGLRHVARECLELLDRGRPDLAFPVHDLPRLLQEVRH